MTPSNAGTPAGALAAYQQWLVKQPLAANTQRTYRVRASLYCAYLATYPADYGDPLHDPSARDYAVRDFKAHLQAVRQAKPNSSNLTLAALDHFYRFLGLGPPHVGRETLPQQAQPAQAGFVAVAATLVAGASGSRQPLDKHRRDGVHSVPSEYLPALTWNSTRSWG